MGASSFMLSTKAVKQILGVHGAGGGLGWNWTVKRLEPPVAQALHLPSLTLMWDSSATAGSTLSAVTT